MTNLRMRLRAETREEHALIDDLYGQHDLSGREGLAVFLRAQALALSWCLSALPYAMADRARNLNGMICAIADDLAGLGAPAQTDRRSPPARFELEPLGLIYVVAGSRLGARLLVRDVLRSEDATVRTATRFLTCPEGDALWRDVLEELSEWSGSQDEEERIIAAARAGFGWFAIAHQDTHRTLPQHDKHYRIA
ncbi:biliverdin-producing heme oxygenase [Henriciella litoralis]|uniref:biliverdin-producing heme oxygenase n=1 Tax=Henriciella litoralis TaxID=568102 RepID=UPI0009FBBA42|nr:biliverdin-producing heme oxygenase [Henriciella litoralis]